ncbi:MAG TPA: hypothetical protein VM865_08015 [Acidobacteriaceae bacterium]|jgi:hypothetical protein|nr:hypothetical protein [Acidobacteriaceae bacterium]
MATKKKPCQEPARPAHSGLPPAYYHLHALLHTLRTLQCHEDELCTLLADVQRTGKVSARTRREILELLHGLPSASLDAEIGAAFSSLDQHEAAA